MSKYDFEMAVGEAAQEAVLFTPHPLPQHLSAGDPRREKYLRDLSEYRLLVGRQVLAAIENLRLASDSQEAQEKPPA